ncbi:MAG TPA: UDP-N-acetylglucosamine 1-carboxyvinyltransferase [Patescibacteria group bacterium]|jgi:UDP-N-acetylglucosamine 1-carboxyvinyltransferase|nr:UDP-N-acetylglucosamine 1-carboxyvinyltransferase [Patescibacteria group bacterium]
MSKFVINGGKQLGGDIRVSGSKNAVLAIMAASVLTKEECVLTNVPQIKDVESMALILKDLGVSVEAEGTTLRINARKLASSSPNPELVSKFRGSILLIGPLLARTGIAEMPFPGGDLIGKRPIDAHVSALKALGAESSANGNLNFSVKKFKGSKVVMEESSVTATENAMMAAVTAQGKTVIKLAAMEPHVQQLGEFLKTMGADIQGYGTPTISISGVSRLHGASVAIIPDSEQAASLITLAAATKSDVTVTGLNPDYLEDFLVRIRKMNINFEVGTDFVHVKLPDKDYVGTKIQSGLYPKLNSDYVPPMAVLATQALGETLIYEWLYENRLGYVAELNKMGANAEILDPHRVKITGPTKLSGKQIKTYDLRMGMTLVIAALTASGQSEISDIHHIDRGYENLEERLTSLGADIKRMD